MKSIKLRVHLKPHSSESVQTSFSFGHNNNACNGLSGRSSQRSQIGLEIIVRRSRFPFVGSESWQAPPHGFLPCLGFVATISVSRAVSHQVMVTFGARVLSPSGNGILIYRYIIHHVSRSSRECHQPQLGQGECFLLYQLPGQ